MATFSQFNNKDLKRTQANLQDVLEKLVIRFDILDEKISYENSHPEILGVFLKLSQEIGYVSQVLASISKIENVRQTRDSLKD